MVYVCPCGDHGLRSDAFCSEFRQFVCSAEMTGEKRDRIAALFIDHHNRRVCFLTYHERSDGSHSDPGGTEKDDSVQSGDPFFCPFSQGPFHFPKRMFLRKLYIFTFHKAIHLLILLLQISQKFFSKDTAMFCECDDSCLFHLILLLPETLW